MTEPAGRLTRREAADLLAVGPEASASEVQHAFLRAARRVHPDVLPDAGDEERRVAAAEFDRLLRARDLLLRPPPATRPPLGRAPDHGRGRGLGGSLVVLALMAFLLVLLLTVQQGLRGLPADPARSGAPGSSVGP